MQKTLSPTAAFIVFGLSFDLVTLVPRGKGNSGPFDPRNVFIDVRDKIWNYLIPGARGQYVRPPSKRQIIAKAVVHEVIAEPLFCLVQHMNPILLSFSNGGIKVFLTEKGDPALDQQVRSINRFAHHISKNV